MSPVAELCNAPIPSTPGPFRSGLSPLVPGTGRDTP